MKMFVRHAGGELVVPSFQEFQALYRMQFISPDDLVRRETGERWLRAGDLPELRSLHLYDRGGRRRAVTLALWLMLGAFALAVMAQLFLLKPAPTFASPPQKSAPRAR
jgi:hypothetical protein